MQPSSRTRPLRHPGTLSNPLCPLIQRTRGTACSISALRPHGGATQAFAENYQRTHMCGHHRPTSQSTVGAPTSGVHGPWAGIHPTKEHKGDMVKHGNWERSKPARGRAKERKHLSAAQGKTQVAGLGGSDRVHGKTTGLVGGLGERSSVNAGGGLHAERRGLVLAEHHGRARHAEADTRAGVDGAIVAGGARHSSRPREEGAGAGHTGQEADGLAHDRDAVCCSRSTYMRNFSSGNTPAGRILENGTGGRAISANVYRSGIYSK